MLPAAALQQVRGEPSKSVDTEHILTTCQYFRFSLPNMSSNVHSAALLRDLPTDPPDDLWQATVAGPTPPRRGFSGRSFPRGIPREPPGDVRERPLKSRPSRETPRKFTRDVLWRGRSSVAQVAWETAARIARALFKRRYRFGGPGVAEINWKQETGAFVQP